jgi:membrane peptidoglycan carboxypeptidase
MVSLPRRRRWWRSWRLLAGLFLFAVLALVATFGAIYATVRIPPTDQDALVQAAVITYADGEVLARLGDRNREDVKLKQVPEPVRLAVLAAEDHTFYSNGGVEPTSIARAVLSNVRGGSQGGSTISQQYVKNVYNQREHSAKRKFTEVFLAIKINRKMSKDAILERYLNTIYLGRNAFGIQSAAQAYFRRDVEQLTVAQGAFLAGIINAPALADPRDGPAQRARAERRWAVVLDAMVKEGWLTADARRQLTFPVTIKPVRDGVLKGQTGYLVSMVEAEVERKLGISEERFRSEGYKIVTTFDKDLIAAELAAVKKSLPKDRPKRLQIGLAAVDPRTGAVRAIYGGSNFLKRQQNTATQDKIEVAGTFSTFTLLAALSAGVDLGQIYNGSTPQRIGNTEVHNYRAKQYGFVNLLQTTEQSVNTAFAQLNAQIGGDSTRKAAYRAGIPRSAELDGKVSNVLGAVGLPALDLAAAYATLGAEGMRRAPFVVQSVTRTTTGQTLLSMDGVSARGERAFPAGVVADATYALEQVVTNGTGSYAARLKRPVAAQTGTSASSRSAWFVGYTPQLATAVSMYQLSRNGKEIERMKGFGRYRSIFGGGYPAHIWTSFMAKALAGQPVALFPGPSLGGRLPAGSRSYLALPGKVPVPLGEVKAIAAPDKRKLTELKLTELKRLGKAR